MCLKLISDNLCCIDLKASLSFKEKLFVLFIPTRSQNEQSVILWVWKNRQYKDYFERKVTKKISRYVKTAKRIQQRNQLEYISKTKIEDKLSFSSVCNNVVSDEYFL